MEPTINQLPGSKVELKFTVTAEEAQPYIDQAVSDISEHKTIPGFRPGKAPYTEVKKAVGEMAIWEMALERIVKAWFVKSVLQQNLETVGSPEVAVDQLTPGADMKFTCTVAVMPAMQKIEVISEPFIELKSKDVTADEIDKAVEDLRKMRHQEVITDAPADKSSMMIIDLEMKKDNVVLEGGVAKSYRVYLTEEHYIPKFADQLIGLKKGDHKEFKLPFPKEHFQKIYAGQEIDFDVTVNDVYEIKLPEVNDEFAKSLGLENLQALRDLLKKNMQSENDRHAMDKAEVELLETLVNKSSFTETPEILIKEEARRMVDEIKRDVESRGGRMEDYLSSLKKSVDELRLDFIPQAIKRVQTSVYVRNIAKENKLEVTDVELDNEIDRLLDVAKDQDKDVRDQISSPEYRDYVHTVMKNRKTLEFLKEKGIKDYKKFMERFAQEDAEHVHDHGEHVHGPDCQHE
ncbi:MAG: trigger factor [Patescibacteria group bacterium]|nr:trigger factor [Patescibacteria group bacterium]